jgi:two-component system chemotaxis response regulator CheY
VRVLLLDDDTRAMEAATLLLQAAGFDVTLSGRRHRRLDFIAEQQPDLLLLGVRVPHVAGDEVLQACTRHPALTQVPVLLMSSCDSAYLEAMVRESGAAGFVRKARLREELVACVTQALSRRRAPSGNQPSNAA